jgi:3',5'-cyclic AMP phosphodiesterase CpdA
MFVLAHLSDPHLAPIPKPRLAELIGKRATGFLNWQRKRRSMHRTEVLECVVADLEAQAPDHIAVTGDLVNIALAGEFAPARAWLERLGSPADVTLVPGNHDAYVRRTAQHSALHWGDYMRGDDGASFPFVRRRRPLTLIGLSTAVPTAPLLATGRLGPDQLKKLAGLLEQYGNGDSFRVVLIHHPPSSKRSRHLKRLVDGAALRDALARHGAELVIHGHDHVSSLTYLEGPRRPIPVVGVPSASEAPPGEHDPAGYNLYRIDGDAGAWRCEAVSRGISSDGASVVEIRRTMLTDV